MKPGVHPVGNRVEFVVHSAAQSMSLLLFDNPEDNAPSREIPMKKKSGIGGPGSIFHVQAPKIMPGQLYLYKTETSQWLLDPCAHALHTPRRWGERPEGRSQKVESQNPKLKTHTSNPFPKCVVVDHAFNWNRDTHPHTPLTDTVIYEAHLRGYTRADDGGTYLDFIKKIPYLQALGITAVEFLPLFEFNELEYAEKGGPRETLLNFWGYSTLGFYAPMSRYAAASHPGGAVTELKTLIKALHAAGIEIILDVVFNHTGEGEKNDPTYHFRALDENAYYLQNPDGTYQNWSGCGNTVNANHPVTKQFIVECLTHWVNEYHIDGFRFDLATSLCRGEDGALLKKPPLFQTLEKQPALKHTKLIAEAWDCDGYQVGHFPAKRFADWNGKFRDDIRRFWNGTQPVANLATRLAGSADLYGHHKRGPLHSINFVTSHDGFTLADLVSYNQKHNEDNREDNRDGENHNDSVNFGTEGPTDDPATRARRLQQQKNLLATLLLSQGVPMLTAGDEFGRTQQGNNNAYCQDNDTSWIDWTLLEKNRDLFEFTKQLIALRKKHPALRRTKHLKENDVQWLNPAGGQPDWHHARALGMNLGDILILINNDPHDVAFTVSSDWKLALATAKPDGFTLPPHSLAAYTK